MNNINIYNLSREQLQQYRDLVCHLPQSNHTKNLDYNSFKKLSNVSYINIVILFSYGNE